jgi:hypothetical protein
MSDPLNHFDLQIVEVKPEQTASNSHQSARDKALSFHL